PGLVRALPRGRRPRNGAAQLPSGAGREAEAALEDPGDELVVPRLSAQRRGRGGRARDGAGARDDVRRRERLGGRRRVGPGGTLLLLRRAQAVSLRLPLVVRGGEQRRRGRAVLRQLLPRGRHGPHRRDAGRGGGDDLPRSLERAALPPGAQPVPVARIGRSSGAIDLLRLPTDRHLGALAAPPGRRRHPRDLPSGLRRERHLQLLLEPAPDTGGPDTTRRRAATRPIASSMRTPGPRNSATT